MRVFDYNKDLRRSNIELSEARKAISKRKPRLMNRVKIDENPEQHKILSERAIRMFNKMFKQTGPREYLWIGDSICQKKTK